VLKIYLRTKWNGQFYGMLCGNFMFFFTTHSWTEQELFQSSPHSYIISTSLFVHYNYLKLFYVYIFIGEELLKNVVLLLFMLFLQNS